MTLEARQAVMDALIAELNSALPADRSEELGRWIREELQRMDEERMRAARAAAGRDSEASDDTEIAIGPPAAPNAN